MEEDECHFIIGGRNINKLYCSDNTALIATNANDVEDLVLKIKEKH